jgi:methionyl-tRNA formyltransferase
MDIIYLGSPDISADVLERLIIGGLKISAVVTRPDKPKGRSNRPEKTPVKIFAESRNIPVFEPQNKAELTEVFMKLKPDLGIVAAYGMIIPKEALNIPKYGLINFHPSLLPLYRGPDPIAMPIMCGEIKTGVSIITVSEGMDEGDILAQEDFPLTGIETTPELEKSLSALGAKMLLSLVPKYIKGAVKPKPQDHTKATYTHLMKKEDAEIFWDKYWAKGIEQAYRAFTPWPGIYSYFKGKKIDFYDIDVVSGKFKPGVVINMDGRILIGTLKGAIAPKYLKLEGKNKVTAEEFIRGYPDFINTNLIKNNTV